MLAWPLIKGAVPQVTAGLPWVKATVPEGMLPSWPRTLAVNVTCWLAVAGLELDDSTRRAGRIVGVAGIDCANCVRSGGKKRCGECRLSGENRCCRQCRGAIVEDHVSGKGAGIHAGCDGSG